MHTRSQWWVGGWRGGSLVSGGGGGWLSAVSLRMIELVIWSVDGEDDTVLVNN